MPHSPRRFLLQRVRATAAAADGSPPCYLADAQPIIVTPAAYSATPSCGGRASEALVLLRRGKDRARRGLGALLGGEHVAGRRSAGAVRCKCSILPIVNAHRCKRLLHQSQRPEQNWNSVFFMEALNRSNAAQGRNHFGIKASGLNRANALQCSFSQLLKKLGRPANALTSASLSP